MLKKKIPNILVNQKNVVSNNLDYHAGLIVGDTEKVLDIKNQFLIQTYSNPEFEFDFHRYIKNLDIAYGTVTADTGDAYDHFNYYPLTEIKRKGSGLNDISKKNTHLPCGFFCIHDYALINRRSFNFNELFHKFTNKKYFVKSITVSSSSICIFPLSNNIKNNPFSRASFYFDKYDLNLISFGKNKKKIIDEIKKFSSKSSFKFKIEGLNKFKESDGKKYNLIKSAVFDIYYYYQTLRDFVVELKKSGAKLELKSQNFKPFEEYDKEKLNLFKKELDLIKKQKNKKEGYGDVIKCNVENGIYNVYNTEIRCEDEIYEGKAHSQYSKAVLVLKK